MTISDDGWAESVITGQIQSHMDMVERLVFDYTLSDDDLSYLECKMVHCLNYIYTLKVINHG